MAVIMMASAALFDTVDGRVARYLNATSEFGKELDSLADLVSFGIAPATLLYMVIMDKDKADVLLEIILPAIFATCGAVRLARYNVLNVKDYFVGIPIPLSGGLLLLSSIAFRHQSHWILGIITLILSFMMVSNIHVPRK
jgi:CDP-diacylglycerol---serine O-phosphatidyltransferase